MIPAIRAFGVRRAAEFAGPHHQSVTQQSARGEIGEQAAQWQIHGGGAGAKIGVEVEMMIPVAMRDLDEAHAGFDELAREQALAAEVVRGRFADAVELLRRVALAAEVHHAGQFGLHFEG